ncbi:MAG: hypothetical protein D6772_05165 [Bacteroidetes bacterium]|nr:MAG: hypothetical protein D6772_05165 [Bacteroidota bacterium]
MRWWVIFVLGSGGLGACGSGTPAQITEYEGPHFSLKRYIGSEIKRLTQSHQAIYKTITLDGETEVLRADSVDYRSELNLFLQADINRPAWADKYQVDSVYENHQLIELHYTALDTSLPTQLLRVRFRPAADSLWVEGVTIRSKSETALSSSQKTLVYHPDKGYTIDVAQSGAMTKDLQFQLQARFE